MDSEKLETLREIAFEFTIDPNNSVHAADAEDVIRVLNAYISSYKSFLKIKLEDENLSKEEIEKTVKDTKLLVVDTEFNSYHRALAPYNHANVNLGIPIFTEYKDEIIDADLSSYSQLQKLKNTYSKDQLYEVFNPIFSVVNSNYTLKTKTSQGVEKKVVKPIDQFKTYFKPTKTKKIESSNDKVFQVFVKSHDINSIQKKDIIFSEELLHETYPYTPDRILCNNKVFIFHDNLVAHVEYIEDLYFISYPDLYIEVWGETRKEAENAFDFTFYSLYLNYVLEDDKNLTDDAILLKDKVRTMIHSIR